MNDVYAPAREGSPDLLMEQGLKQAWFQRLSFTWTEVLVLFTCLMLPMSSSAKSIGLTLSLIAIASITTYRKAALSLLRTSWGISLLLLIGFTLFACFWSPASFTAKMLMMEKISKVLYLPFLVVVFRKPMMRSAGLHAVLLSTALVSLLAILAYEHWLFVLKIDPDHVFRNHIVMGLIGAFSTFLSAHLAMQAKGKLRWFYFVLVGLLSFYILAVNAGRTGYVLYAVFMLLWLWRYFTAIQMIMGCLALAVVMSSGYLFSPVMHTRVNSVVSDLRAYHAASQETPVGFRLQFHAFAKKLFYRHPLLGNGTGSFSYYVEQENPFPGWDGKHLVEPHSQYWLVAAEGGVVGLVLLLSFYGTLLFKTRYLKQTGSLAWGVLVAFLLSQCSDSMLFYSASGFFFIMMMAICLGEGYENSV